MSVLTKKGVEECQKWIRTHDGSTMPFDVVQNLLDTISDKDSLIAQLKGIVEELTCLPKGTL
jgi:hypothetical protein